MTHLDRVARFAKISSALALKSDEQLDQLAGAAHQRAAGIGGDTAVFEIEGIKVFAKRVRLTETELRPENRGSTANIFQLPAYCHRNLGVPGFGAWRELAAHAMANGWILSRQLESVPMMYHSRILSGAISDSPGALPDELANIEDVVAYWGGSEALRRRLAALADATASILIFLEYFPWNLSAWLDQKLSGASGDIEAAFERVEQNLSTEIPVMNSLGLLHGDAHFANILTDGEQLYFADFGLAIFKRFDLSADEASYLHDNATLDRAYVLANWINRVVRTWAPTLSVPQERNALVRTVASQGSLAGTLPNLPRSVAESFLRHAPVAAVFNDFYARLHSESRSTPYPREEIEAMLDRSDG
jgi:hypothetical protein